MYRVLRCKAFTLKLGRSWQTPWSTASRFGLKVAITKSAMVEGAVVAEVVEGVDVVMPTVICRNHDASVDVNGGYI